MQDPCVCAITAWKYSKSIRNVFPLWWPTLKMRCKSPSLFAMRKGMMISSHFLHPIKSILPTSDHFPFGVLAKQSPFAKPLVTFHEQDGSGYHCVLVKFATTQINTQDPKALKVVLTQPLSTLWLHENKSFTWTKNLDFHWTSLAIAILNVTMPLRSISYVANLI